MRIDRTGGEKAPLPPKVTIVRQQASLVYTLTPALSLSSPPVYFPPSCLLYVAFHFWVAGPHQFTWRTVRAGRQLACSFQVLDQLHHPGLVKRFALFLQRGVQSLVDLLKLGPRDVADLIPPQRHVCVATALQGSSFQVCPLLELGVVVEPPLCLFIKRGKVTDWRPVVSTCDGVVGSHAHQNARTPKRMSRRRCIGADTQMFGCQPHTKTLNKSKTVA